MSESGSQPTDVGADFMSHYRRARTSSNLATRVADFTGEAFLVCLFDDVISPLDDVLSSHFFDDVSF